MELNQSLPQFYATVKNGKGEHYGVSSYVGPRARLNRYINHPPISRSLSDERSCVYQATKFHWSSKKNFAEKDVTKQLTFRKAPPSKDNRPIRV